MLALVRVLAAACVLLVVAAPIRSAPPDPLRLIPREADAVIKIEHPRRLIESFTKLDAYQQFRQLDFVRGYLDTQPVRSFFELIAYYERELGAPWPELLDKLAGGGMALGISYAPANSPKERKSLDLKVADAAASYPGGRRPALLAIQGTDEALMTRFVEKALTVLDQEQPFAESKGKPARAQYKGIETVRVAPQFHFARAGLTLLIATSDEALRAGIDRCGSDADKPASMADAEGPKRAQELLPPDPLLWAWVNIEPAKKGVMAKDLFAQPRDNFILTFVFAGILDVGRRSPFVAAGLYQQDDGFLFTVRMPAGREGHGGDAVLHLPDHPKSAGTLPLLEPKGVIYSHSFYQDLGALWEQRTKILNERSVKDFEENEKNVSRVLPGASLGNLFKQSGPHWRIVATNPKGSPAYKVEPAVRGGAFAVVVSMRDSAFARSIEALIRGGALLAGFQVGGLKLFEEQVGDVKMFGYRFNEDGKFAIDTENVRFNYEPSFAAVDDQYVFASHRELCKELIEELRKQKGVPPQSQNMRLRVYAKAAADSFNLVPDQLITQTILGQGVSETDARKQTDALVKYLERLGIVTLETDYTDKTFRFDARWQLKK
jgi:hypothetical protein